MRQQGIINSWNDTKGFGFIAPENGGKPVFIHITALRNRQRRPAPGQPVSYTLATDPQNRLCAANVELTGTWALPAITASPPVLAAVGFLGIVVIAVLSHRIPLLVLLLYLAVSLLTFIIYALDKSAARKDTWRTQESTLHLLALLGGWPGALIAQQKLRHKSSKPSFRLICWLTILLNCAAFAWLFTPSGTATTQFLLARIADYV